MGCTHTHTADSLCPLCRELGRPWRQSPDTLVQGAAPARLEECPAIFHTAEGTSHLRTGVPFAHFPHPTPPHLRVDVDPRADDVGAASASAPELRVKEEGAETCLSCQHFTCLLSAPAWIPPTSSLLPKPQHPHTSAIPGSSYSGPKE